MEPHQDKSQGFDGQSHQPGHQRVNSDGGADHRLTENRQVTGYGTDTYGPGTYVPENQGSASPQPGSYDAADQRGQGAGYQPANTAYLPYTQEELHNYSGRGEHQPPGYGGGNYSPAMGAPNGYGERYYHPGYAEPRRKKGGFITGLTVGAVALVLIGGAVGGVIGSELSQHGSNSSSEIQMAPTESAANTSPAPTGSVQAVAAKVLPSVVSIQTRSDSGSGVILTADGKILTNNHVVASAGMGGQVLVSFNDGSTATGKVIGQDPISDIAVVQVNKSGLKPITVASSKNLAVGQGVVAVGSPLGLSGTVTSGIVSALNRPVSARGEQSDQVSVISAIQTDAPINPGNSGGALVNMNGDLIGINSSIATLSRGEGGQSGSIGLGFAIPADQAVRVAKQLINTGRAQHAAIGVTIQQNQSAMVPGAVIASVIPGGPFSKAGIPSGSLVTRVDNMPIGTGVDLIAAVRAHQPGEKINVTYTDKPGDQPKTVSVTLGNLGS